MDAALGQFLADLDYSFADDALLHRALRHASLDVDDDNEHLEFLGDRVLGLVIAEELLARYPHEKEGDLARRLAELVSRRICAEIAAEVNLNAVIRCDPGQRDGGEPHEMPSRVAAVGTLDIRNKRRSRTSRFDRWSVGAERKSGRSRGGGGGGGRR